MFRAVPFVYSARKNQIKIHKFNLNMSTQYFPVSFKQKRF